MTQHSMFGIETVAPRIRKVTFSNPPVNVVGVDTVAQLLEVVDELSRDEQVQVVISTAVRPDTSSTTPISARCPNFWRSPAQTGLLPGSTSSRA